MQQLENIKPKLMAFLICNHIEAEKNILNSKKSISGIFDKMNSAGLPCSGNFNIFLRFLGGKGKQKLRILIQKPSGKVVIDPVEVDFEMVSMDSFMDVIVPLDSKLNFDEWGIYKVRLYLGGKDNLIAEHPIGLEKSNG
jgi:hypothetical protein